MAMIVLLLLLLVMQLTIEKLTGSWLFTPDDTDNYWVRDTVDSYKAETYVEYGYWLTAGTDPDPVDLQVYSVVRGPDAHGTAI